MDSRTGILLFALCAFSTTASAQKSDRTNSWDMGFSLSDYSSENLSGSNGSGLSIDNDIGWGFYANYNISSRLALGGELSFSNPDYQAKRVIDGTNLVQTVDATLDVATIHFNGTFYFTEGALAPYVQAGAGWTRVDSNIADGAPTTGCWWDPWWGYICTSFYDTYTETRTSYNYGVGLRWELTDEFVIRAAYGIVEVDTSHETDAQLDTIHLDFGWRF